METSTLAPSFATAMVSAGLSKSDAISFLEISAEELERLISGVKLPTPQQLRALSIVSMLGHRDTGTQSSLFPEALTQQPLRKRELAQFFTSPEIAAFMARMFSTPSKPIMLLDAGAGEGALTCAFVNQWKNQALMAGEAHELDEIAHATLSENLKQIESGKSFVAIKGDFLDFATNQIRNGCARRFTHAILNPPYKKISTSSHHRRILSEVGLETVNLYTAFVAMAVALAADGAEIVAIIPRSFCNGPYYKGFRQFLFDRCALNVIHVFERRDRAFAADGVLQENVIIKLTVGHPQGEVKISASADQTFADNWIAWSKFSDVVRPGDPDLFIHIPSARTPESVAQVKFKAVLSDLGLSCSTGPVVDFRVKEYLLPSTTAGSVPLLYPCHFENSKINWPSGQSKKPNAVLISRQTQKMLLPKGYYVVVRRFSSKEERRRIYASVLSPEELPGSLIGIENHLNYFHADKKPLEKEFCWGLAAYLMSSAVDEEFRKFSGHTQVNSTDLRKMHYPTKEQILALGGEMMRIGSIESKSVDAFLEAIA